MSGFKEISVGGVTGGRGTIAGGNAAPLTDVLDYITKAAASYRGTIAAPTLALVDLFDIFGVKPGDWPALVLRLVRDRWPGITVIDSRRKSGRPRKPSSVADQVLIAEVAAIKFGAQKMVRDLNCAGWTVPRIAAKTNLTSKQVQSILKGREMVDRAALRLHLAYSGKAKPGHNKEVTERRLNSFAVEYSRAVQAHRKLG